jgi:hypothetical protein
MDSSEANQCMTAWLGYLSICTCVTSQKKKLIILKLDFEKTFDKIEHDVIIEVMRQRIPTEMDSMDSRHPDNRHFVNIAKWNSQQGLSL